MDLVNFLRSNTASSYHRSLAVPEAIDALRKKYPVSAKHDSEYPELVCFHYTYIPQHLKRDPILNQCRGIVLNSQDDWNIVSYPYDKHYNYGEPEAANIDPNTMRVYEKLDGSLMTLYCYKGNWRVSSSSVANASGKCNTGLIFSNLFERAWNYEGYPNKNRLDSNYCYMFELCTNDNRVVLEHPYDKLVLHGVRNLVTLREVDPLVAARQYGFKTPKIFSGSDMKELARFVDTIGDIEGFVVVDANFNRNKMKTEAYLKLHHTATSRGSNLYEMILKAVQHRNTDEWLAKFPMHTEICNKIEKQFEQILNDVCDTYGRFEEKNKKNFALNIKDHQYKRFLFSIYNSQCDPETYMRTVSVLDLMPYFKL